jgi:MFS family permease
MPKTTLYKYFWFFVLCGMMAIDFADRSVMSIVLPSIQREFQINDTLAGMLGSVFSLSLALLVIPTTLWAERWNRSKACSLMVAIWSLATLFTGLSTSFPFLLLSRICVAAGEAGYIPVAYTLICDQYPERRRGFLLGLFQASGVIGTIFGNIAIGYATVMYGWRSSFVGLFAVGLCFALVCWFMPASSHAKSDDRDKSLDKHGVVSHKLDFAKTISYLFRLPGFPLLYLILGLATMMSSSILLWTPTLLVRRMDLSIVDASIIASICSLSAVVLGPLLGLAGDFLKRRFLFGRLIVAFFCAALHPLLIWISLLTSSSKEDLIQFSIFWSLGVGVLAGIFSNVVAHLQESVPNEFRSIASSLIPIGNQMLGGMVGPILLGAFSDRFGIALSLAALATLAMTPTLILLCLAGWKIRRGDLIS